VEDSQPVGSLAPLIAAALGLTQSSQDWLLTNDGAVFLEANPGGEWLFLESAREGVVANLVEHLVQG
jgi:hypothetical protein